MLGIWEMQISSLLPSLPGLLWLGVVAPDRILSMGHIRGAYDKFPDFFRMGTFIDSTHMKL